MKNILSYFKQERKAIIIVTITGLIYNIGLIANPYFEGSLVGLIGDILNNKASYNDIIKIVIAYVLIITFVQINRYYKREYVRVFANNINKTMKLKIFHNLLSTSTNKLKQEGIGNILTKAIIDVDDCSEGVRKFTTEIFDTGVAFLAYFGMMLVLDIKITLLCFIFIPISFYLAQKAKILVQKNSVLAKKASANLSNVTLDNGDNYLTYRVNGIEQERINAYEKYLIEYEKANIKAGLPNSLLPPLYKSLSYLGILFILFLGIRNIENNIWTIATLTTFISSFMKMSEKAAKSAALFNSVHKAEVSYERIKEYLETEVDDISPGIIDVDNLKIEHLSFKYPNKDYLFKDLNLEAYKGQIIGVTGPVASGKSTFGKLFLNDLDYEGKILINNIELHELKDKKVVTYLGHDGELFNDTVEDNISFGKDIDVDYYLKLVCLDNELNKDSIVGDKGSSLSGGQAKRLGLARTLANASSILVLDDPFSALDKNTEARIFANLRKYYNDKIIILISHRLNMFDKCDQVIFMNNKTYTDTHLNLYKNVEEYKELYDLQKDNYEH